MNYLAHLYFADPDPHSIIGNLAADAVKGAVDPSDPLFAGITLHRRLDAFTDSHPATGASRRRLEPKFRHTSRIIVDVFADHFLARSWDRYSNEPFDDFVDRTYSTIDGHLHLFPLDTASRFSSMTRHDWLRGYSSVEGIRMALRSLSKRLRRPLPLERACDDLEERRAEFESDFHELFTDAVQLLRSSSAPAASSRLQDRSE